MPCAQFTVLCTVEKWLFPVHCAVRTTKPECRLMPSRFAQSLSGLGTRAEPQHPRHHQNPLKKVKVKKVGWRLGQQYGADVFLHSRLIILITITIKILVFHNVNKNRTLLMITKTCTMRVLVTNVFGRLLFAPWLLEASPQGPMILIRNTLRYWSSSSSS